MAKRKKRARAQPRRRGKLRRRASAARARARKASKSARTRGTKRAVGSAKPKRETKEVAQKKRQRMKSPIREIQTVVVDVIEEPAPGVITITEFEETQVPPRGRVEIKGDRED